MKRLLVLVLVAATAAFGIPSGVAAQASDAVIQGQSVDAAGRPIVGQRVELVRDAVIVQTATTGARGEFSFANIAAGEYIVRMTLNGQVAGMRLSVTPGQTASATIVAPSAATPSNAFLVLPLLPLLTAAAVAAAVVTTAIVVTGS